MEIRSTDERIANALHLIETEVDTWVASASADGDAYLIPLSYAWTGSRFIIATPETSITAHNLQRAGWARIAIGPTRDVVMIEGWIEMTIPEHDDTIWDVHAAGAGFDARQGDSAYVLLTLTPDRIQTWRTPAELPGRLVMRDGQWLGSGTLFEASL